MDTEPRSAKGRRTRARLLTAGKAVFERDGFLQARITDIAAEAEVSHGSFYHYFDSKESLFREIAEEVEVRLVSMDDIPHQVGHDSGPVDRIRAANRSYLTAYKKEARIMRVIEEVSRYDETVRGVRVKRATTTSPPGWKRPSPGCKLTATRTRGSTPGTRPSRWAAWSRGSPR